MKQPLTTNEKAVYDYIVRMKKNGGIVPSIRDIKNELELKSTATVHTLITRLEDKGYITREKSKSRSLLLCEEATGISGGDGAFSVPVLGEVAAGKPILAADNHMFYIDFPRREGMNLQGELFGLRVKGESMIGAGIMPGDIVVVAKSAVCRDGEIVVALLGDEATVKRFFKEDGGYRLQPENPEMEPIIAKSVTLLGRVISVIRYYGN